MKPLRPFAWVVPTLLAALLWAAGWLYAAQRGHAQPADAFAYGVVGAYLAGVVGCASVAHRHVVRAEAAAAASDAEVRRLRRERLVWTQDRCP